MEAAPTRKQRRTISENVDETKPASVVINKGGGLSNFARDYEFAVSTVHGWRVKGFVPAKTRDDKPELGPISYQAWILHRSEQLGHKITAEDFIEKPLTAAA